MLNLIDWTGTKALILARPKSCCLDLANDRRYGVPIMDWASYLIAIDQWDWLVNHNVKMKSWD